MNRGLATRTRSMVLVLSWLLGAIFTVACRPAPSEGVAIFLLAQDIAPHDVANMDLDSLPLMAEPLLTSDDFVFYRADTHAIQLPASGCYKLRRAFPHPISVRGVPFVVCAGNERIYAGAFWTPLSSSSFDGIVIQQPCMMQEQTMRIELGYPSPSFFTGHDPRSDPRILSALRAAGKLK